MAVGIRVPGELTSHCTQKFANVKHKLEEADSAVGVFVHIVVA